MRQELESRRQEALTLVAVCTQLLTSRYGARRVIPFGSVLEEEAWHERSDLDLAVEGLSSEALWQAEKDLEAMVPLWLEVDLIPLERAFPELRSRILGERTMPESPYLALKVRLDDELLGLERITERLKMALERAGQAPDEFAMRALASYADDFYKGCEHLCERVAVALDGGLPQGERWHQVLLLTGTLKTKVLTRETALDNAGFSSHPFHGILEFMAQMTDRQAAHIPELDSC